MFAYSQFVSVIGVSPTYPYVGTYDYADQHCDCGDGYSHHNPYGDRYPHLHLAT